MSTTELFLEVSEAPNPKIIRIFDTSNYCVDDIENYLIEVLPVNKNAWVVFHVQKNFSLVLNSSNLGYRKVVNVDQLGDLPDGIYEIKQSYKPNIHTVQHYLHMRTVGLMRKIRNEWNKLISDTCKLSREEFSKSRDKLREIEEYATAAKWKVEECLEKKQGKELYEWAVKLLEIYTNECKC